MTEKAAPTIVDPQRVSPLEIDDAIRGDTMIGGIGVFHMSPELGTDDLQVNAIEFEPGARFRPHKHRFDQILYYAYGTGIVAVDGGEDTLVPAGQYVLLPADTVHMHGCTADGPALQLSMMRDTETTFDVACPPGWESFAPGARPSG